MSYVSATVLQQNEVVYVNQVGGDLQIGRASQRVPAVGDYIEVIGEFWADPIYDGGQFRGYDYVPVEKTATAPTYGAFKVTCVKDKLTGDTVWIMVTLANYLAGTYTATTAPVPVAPQPVACLDSDSTTNRTYHFTMPFSAANFKAYVTIAGVIQDTPVAQSSLANLVTWLNTNIPEAGTWSAASGYLKLVNTSGAAIGVTIVASA